MMASLTEMEQTWGGAKFGSKTEVDFGHVYNETEERPGAGEED